MNINEQNTRANAVVDRLLAQFPNASTELIYDKNDPWQLLVVVSLSAQTTDKNVNQVSPGLFKRFKSVHDFAKATPAEVEPYIKSLGLFRNKAKNVVLAAQKLISDFNGEVPKTRAELETLAGIGSKTSAVIAANAFNIPAIAVDTHVSRVAQRLGLTINTDPKKIEADLTKLLPPGRLLEAHNTFILHGRYTCIARKPRCSVCVLADCCPRIGVVSSQ